MRRISGPKSVIREFQEKYQIEFMHAYGMTETSPVVTVSRLKAISTAKTLSISSA